MRLDSSDATGTKTTPAVGPGAAASYALGNGLPTAAGGAAADTGKPGWDLVPAPITFPETDMPASPAHPAPSTPETINPADSATNTSEQGQKVHEGSAETRPDRTAQQQDGGDVEGDMSMPHERDQSSHMTNGVPNSKIKQGAKDVERGLQDTSKGLELDRTYQKQR